MANLLLDTSGRLKKVGHKRFGQAEMIFVVIIDFA
jgi:hypothetical protein